ncbi:MAG: hypothetical protein RJA49_2269 [Actinomycetota bacterium]
MSTPLGPAGWHPDPVGRYEYRYYNGTAWTADVSVHGQRFIDPSGPPTWEQGWGATAATTRHKRGMATASFIIGLVCLLLAWVPFVFAVAAAGAVAALVFGIVGLGKAKEQDGYGRGFAITGIVLAVCALLLCIAGFALTRVVLREVTAYLEPGPHTPVITSCEITDNTLRMTGTLRNDDVTHDYTVVVDFIVNGSTTDTESLTVQDLAPGATAPLKSSAFTLKSGPAECQLTIYGPTPFDLSQKDLGNN